ncbi:MAG: hypothetical protein U0Y08_05855 [Bacteroidia bacterium]
MKMLRNKITASLALMVALSVPAFAKMNVGGGMAHKKPATQKVAAGCVTTAAQIDLDVNQVRARILVGGDLWWDPVGQTPYYEVPIGSNKNSIYSGALWIGGWDQNQNLYVAAQTYRQNSSNDFWGGPTSKTSPSAQPDITADRCDEFDRFWTINRTDVEDFLAGNTPTDDIKSWPGNGNVANGELPNLAPFFDANNDGTYNWEDGDYPYFKLDGNYPVDPSTGQPVCNDYLFGDRSIWWVFNDVGGNKTETNSNPIGLEIRAQAFAFNTTNDINYMTFYKYQIINRSSNQLDSTYFGVWCDPDLGNAADDYVGCDVGLGLGYVYNGDPDDDGGGGYGLNPPAIGIDFFQGPLADAGDGVDNDKDGAVDEPGEEITMSRFVYYINVNNVPNGNPFTGDDYYEYLSGSWCDGQPITYGGDGRGGGSGATTTPCEYMFPDNTDPNFSTPWTMVTANIQPDDMRFLQSAGTFTLQPGAVNYITTGVVWGRATTGGPLASVSVVKRSDALAQALFRNCFGVLDGPDAPAVAIREMDQKLILSFEGTKTNKTELYSQLDPNIPGVIIDQVNDTTFVPDTLTTDEKSYKFQGYKLYQVADENVSVADINDPAKAKLIAQLDIKDGVGKLINFSYDNFLNAYVPTQKTEDADQGLKQTFEITQDLFTLKALSNYRPYYFLAVSYAYNNYRPFDPMAPDETKQQKEPYLQGRKNVKVYSGIPHKPVVHNGGMVLNSQYGDGVVVTRIEGTGNGGNVLDMTQASIDEAMSGAPHRSLNPVYEAGRGPINPYIYDPIGVKGGTYNLRFEGLTNTSHYGLLTENAVNRALNGVDIVQGLAGEADSLLLHVQSGDAYKVGGYVYVDSVSGITVPAGLNKQFHRIVRTNGVDSVYVLAVDPSGTFVPGVATVALAVERCPYDITQPSDFVLESNKVVMNINTVPDKVIGAKDNAGNIVAGNGFLEATITYKDPSKAWLTGIKDVDGSDSADWIRAGVEPSTSPIGGDVNVSGFLDPNEVYENVLGGTWAPFRLTSSLGVGAPKFDDLLNVINSWDYYNSVDVVFTSDKSKWSRCVVFETGEDTMPTVGGATNLGRRKQPSVDKNGNPGDGVVTTDPEDADYINAEGMGWFPGYAINVETGERLNIAFGENSALAGENTQDMRFNPTTNTGYDDNGRMAWGGMHYIWVFNKTGSGAADFPIYDGCAKIRSTIEPNTSSTKRLGFRGAIWTTLPIVAAGHQDNETETRVRIRIVKNYGTFLSSGAAAQNASNPYYKFTIPGSSEATTGVTDVAKNALDYIRVVPNPYYAYSSYEKTRKDQLDNRVRITNLPRKCTVSIYTVNGTLVRQYKRDVGSDLSTGSSVVEGVDFNQATTLDWDLKNTAGITVASGMYIIHVDAGELGEKVVKWFGIMRPIDLDSF